MTRRGLLSTQLRRLIHAHVVSGSDTADTHSQLSFFSTIFALSLLFHALPAYLELRRARCGAGKRAGAAQSAPLMAATARQANSRLRSAGLACLGTRLHAIRLVHTRETPCA